MKHFAQGHIDGELPLLWGLLFFLNTIPILPDLICRRAGRQC